MLGFCLLGVVRWAHYRKASKPIIIAQSEKLPITKSVSTYQKE
jgi:hypothetical protein